jgi:hypothetical protein
MYDWTAARRPLSAGSETTRRPGCGVRVRQDQLCQHNGHDLSNEQNYFHWTTLKLRQGKTAERYGLLAINNWSSIGHSDRMTRRAIITCLGEVLLPYKAVENCTCQVLLDLLVTSQVSGVVYPAPNYRHFPKKKKPNTRNMRPSWSIYLVKSGYRKQSISLPQSALIHQVNLR